MSSQRKQVKSQGYKNRSNNSKERNDRMKRWGVKSNRPKRRNSNSKNSENKSRNNNKSEESNNRSEITKNQSIKRSSWSNNTNHARKVHQRWWTIPQCNNPKKNDNPLFYFLSYLPHLYYFCIKYVAIPLKNLL